MKFTEQTFRKILKICAIFFAFVGLCSLCIFIPQIRELIIGFGENLIGRPLTHSVWHERFINWEIKWLITDLIFICLLLYFSFAKLPDFFNSKVGIFHLKQELSSISKTKSQLFAIIAIFIVLIGVRFFYITQKKSLHVDEGLSISICNRNEYGFWGKNYELNHEYTGKELKEISLWDNPSILDSLSDVFHMHQYNRDTPHTNFYYSLFRLWFIGSKTGNIKNIIWRGCLLNILFFMVSFFFMTLLIKRFTKNSLIISLSLLIAFINPISLSLTVFLRPYELQQTFIIILTYYVVCILQAKKENIKIETKKNFLIGIFVLGLTMLAAYFNILLIGLYGLFIIILCIKEKDWNLMKFFIFMFIGGLIVAKLLYFDFGDISYRGAEAASNLSIQNIISNLIAVKVGIVKIITKNLFLELYCIASLLACFWMIIKNIKKRDSFIPTVIIAINFLALFSILYFAPIDMKTQRYIAPLFPIFALCFVNLFNQKYLNLLLSSIIVLCLMFSLIRFNEKKSVVENLDNASIEKYDVIQNSELPIFVRGSSNWRYSCLIPYLNDENKVIFIEDYNELENKYTNFAPLIFINQADDSEKYTFIIEKLKATKLESIGYHDVYLIEK